MRTRLYAVDPRGIVDSARAFIVPTAVVVGTIPVPITVGLFRDSPASTPGGGFTMVLTSRPAAGHPPTRPDLPATAAS
ncbi:hypothetical protein ACIBBB_00235 [Streptomyces sp. NPDC051217]|uniref:hypothetical protein n=1 Tax=Streptomyces sp. NPDC051217 TaxID=3365644 RepID=UPI003792013D